MRNMYAYIHNNDIYMYIYIYIYIYILCTGTLELPGYLLYVEVAAGRFVLKAISLFDQTQRE